MAKEFIVRVAKSYATASDINIEDLRKRKGFKSPFGRGACPFKDGQAVGKFISFDELAWSNGDYDGCYLGIKFDGVKDSMALSMFVSENEDALDEHGNFIHIENPDEGLAKVMRQHSELTTELLSDIQSYLKNGEHHIKITTFITRTPWGKRQRRHLVNVI